MGPSRDGFGIPTNAPATRLRSVPHAAPEAPFTGHLSASGLGDLDDRLGGEMLPAPWGFHSGRNGESDPGYFGGIQSGLDTVPPFPRPQYF